MPHCNDLREFMSRLTGIVILLTLRVTCQAAESFDVSATLALGGHLGSGTMTELRVQASSSTGGTVSVKTMGGSPDVRFSFRISPGQRVSSYAPIGVDPGAPMPVVLARINGSKWQRASLPSAIVSSRIFVAGQQVVDALTDSMDVVALDGADLPRLPQVYSNISALAVDGDTLARLDDAQLRSLLGFAGSCGRILLLDVAATVQQVFTRRAACGGRYLRVAADLSAVATDFRTLLDMAAPDMPSRVQMQQLIRSSPGGSPDLAAVGVFFCLYFIAIIALATQSRNPATVIGLAVTASLLTIVIWPAAMSREFIAWAESSFDDDVAIYRGLEQHLASRRRSYLLTGSRYENQRVRIVGADYRIEWNEDQHSATLAWDAMPFDVLRQDYVGSFSIDRTLYAGLGEEFVTICNRGRQASQSAYLHWDGSIYEVPPLMPGGTWTNDNVAAMSIDSELSGELSLFRSRSAAHRLTMLTVLPMADDIGRAWLMRYASGETGATSCAA